MHIVRSMVDHLALQAMEVVTGIFGRALKRSEMLGCHQSVPVWGWVMVPLHACRERG